MHSATKYLGGHGTSIGGVIVDGGTFDFAADPERFPNYNTPDPSYHGLVFARDLGVGGPLGANLAFILKARVQLLRDLGPAISPFNAFLIAQGIETLSAADRAARRERAEGRGVAAGPRRGRVGRLGLAADARRTRWRGSTRPRGAGAVLAFEIEGGARGRQEVRRGAELHSHVANIGDVRSLVIHPASTTHSQVADEDRLAAGVTPGLVRLAVGIEHIDDILADLEQGFTAAKLD